MSATSIVDSRSDGIIVPWQASRQREQAEAENIVVSASHLGLGFNPMVLDVVLYAIADRLVLPEGEWRPFQPLGLKRLSFSGAFIR